MPAKPATLYRLVLTAAILAGAFAMRLYAPAAAPEARTASIAYDPALNIQLPTTQADGTIKDQGIDSAIVLVHE